VLVVEGVLVHLALVPVGGQRLHHRPAVWPLGAEQADPQRGHALVDRVLSPQTVVHRFSVLPVQLGWPDTGLGEYLFCDQDKEKEKEKDK
jgi:hypothetical protein